MDSNQDQQISTEPAYARLHTPFAIVFDLILSGIFFYFMLDVIRPHVPTDTTWAINLFGGITTFCLTLFFWLGLQCLRVTWVDQIRNSKNKQ